MCDFLVLYLALLILLFVVYEDEKEDELRVLIYTAGLVIAVNESISSAASYVILFASSHGNYSWHHPEFFRFLQVMLLSYYIRCVCLTVSCAVGF